MDDAILDCIFNPVLQHDPNMLFRDINDQKMTARPLTDEEEKAMPEEMEAIKLAESGKLQEAYDMLTKVVESISTYASAYNNRAQVLRLLKREDDALEDLNKAIIYSEGKGRVAENAYVQRGALYKLRRLDNEARDDFQKAADLGNIKAKEELVLMNPYAKMCNQMLAEVMGAMEGQPENGL
eukprot:CFRG2355T1